MLCASEYVILLRGSDLEATKHLRDVRGMLRVLGGTIDRDALERDAAAFGLSAAWKEMANLRD